MIFNKEKKNCLLLNYIEFLSIQATAEGQPLEISELLIHICNGF